MWWIVLSCQSQPAPQPVERPPPEVSEEEAALAKPRPSWVEARVAEAHGRLPQTEAGTLLREAMDAAGGLAAWYRASPLAFHFDYQPLDGKPPRDTRQVVDTWRSLAVHTWVPDERVTFGWNGEVAWVAGPPDVEMPINARFWALTPYYFVGMPFVLADEGLNLTMAGRATLEDQPCRLVRVDFDEGIGDASDDAYVVYLDETTHRVLGLRYVVSYPGFFDKGDHSPWKLMVFDGEQEMAGLTLPERYRTFTWVGDDEEGAPGELVTTITLSELAVRHELNRTSFGMPEEARPQVAY